MSERDEGVSIDGPLQLLKVLLRPDTLPHIVLLVLGTGGLYGYCLLYTSPSPRD